MTNLSESESKKIAEGLGESKKFLQIVSSGYARQIRHLPSGIKDKDLSGAIMQAAKIYAGKEVNPFLLAECKKFTENKFGHLAPSEIIEAFRQWSIGEIAEKEECYKFSIKFLGTILTAYAKRRKLVYAAMFRQAQENRETEAERKKKEQRDKEFEEQFEQMILEKSKNIKSWQSVPGWWFRAAWRRNLIRISKEEAAAIKVESIPLAKIEIQKEREGQIIDFTKLAEGQDFEAKVKVIAGKIAMFRKFCQ